AGRDQWLVHVQCAGKRALDAAEINPALRPEDRLVATGAPRGFNLRFRAANIRQRAHVFWQFAHRSSRIQALTSCKSWVSSTGSVDEGGIFLTRMPWSD